MDENARRIGVIGYLPEGSRNTTVTQPQVVSSPRSQFAKRERDVLELLRNRIAIKDIAGLLEISANTVRQRIRLSCEIAQVVNETELMLFLFQNPHILERGASCAPGLHIPVMRGSDDPIPELLEPCKCGDPSCLGPVAMMLKMA